MVRGLAQRVKGKGVDVGRAGKGVGRGLAQRVKGKRGGFGPGW